jgi:predicted choloylglycine hydrolase
MKNKKGDFEVGGGIKFLFVKMRRIMHWDIRKNNSFSYIKQEFELTNFNCNLIHLLIFTIYFYQITSLLYV